MHAVLAVHPSGVLAPGWEHDRPAHRRRRPRRRAGHAHEVVHTPKVLHRLAGLPLVAHVLRTAASLEPEHLAVVVRHERERVAAEVAERAPDAIVVDQDEVPGTGRAVQVAVQALPDDFDGTVVVLSGDVPLLDAVSLRALLNAHAGNAVTLVSAIADDATGSRPHRPRRRRRLRRHRRAQGRDGRPAHHHRVQRRHLRLRRDAPARRAAVAHHRERPGRAVRHRRARPRHRAWRCRRRRHPDRPVARSGINDRAQLSDDAARELNARIVRRHQVAGSPCRTRPRPGSTSTSRSRPTPRSCPGRSSWARRRSPPARWSGRTPRSATPRSAPARW